MNIKNLITAIFAIFLVVVLVKQNIKSNEIKSWPETTAIITDSYVSDWNRTKRTTIDDLKINREVTEYELKVSYEYEVDGIPYYGTTLSNKRRKTRSLRSIENMLDRFPVGKEVPVYYDSLNPSDSVLLR